MSEVIVPDYFENFHCKCGMCRNPCCDGWGINVSEHEYFKLIGIECSKRLRHKLDDAFVISDFPSEDSYASIQPNYLEQCPMLDQDGLCLLQKEKGETMLPLICRVYPRTVKNYGGTHEICMSCSCEETVELLMSSTNPLTLHTIFTELPFDGINICNISPEKDALRHSVLDIMCDNSTEICGRLKKIGESVCGQSFEYGTDRSSSLISLINFLTVLCKRSQSIRRFGMKALDFISSENDEEKLEKFDQAEKHLYDIIPDLDAYAGRIISNHMLYESFPFVSDGGSVDSVFASFLSAVAVLKILCVCGMNDSDDMTKFCDIIGFANRFIEHSDFYKACARLSHPEAHRVFTIFSPILEKYH